MSVQIKCDFCDYNINTGDFVMCGDCVNRMQKTIDKLTEGRAELLELIAAYQDNEEEEKGDNPEASYPV